MDYPESDQPSLSQLGSEVRADLERLRQSARRRGEQAMSQLRGFVVEHPILALGLAFGTGYTLSGALLSKTTLRAARLLGRFYLPRLLSRLGDLGDVLGAQGDG